MFKHTFILLISKLICCIKTNRVKNKWQMIKEVENNRIVTKSYEFQATKYNCYFSIEY